MLNQNNKTKVESRDKIDRIILIYRKHVQEIGEEKTQQNKTIHAFFPLSHSQKIISSPLSPQALLVIRSI